MRSLHLPVHMWKLKQMAKHREKLDFMKKRGRFRVVESTALVLGYFWYNGSIHSVVARVLS